jgi:hypothetical protein
VSSSREVSFARSRSSAGPALLPTIGFAILAVFTQTMFAQFVRLHGAVPSLVTIAVVLYAAKVGDATGSNVRDHRGLLEDSFAGTGGAWTIATTLTALAVGGISRTFFSDGFRNARRAGRAWRSSARRHFLGRHELEGYPPGLAAAHFHAALWQAAITASCAMALSGRSRAVHRRPHDRRALSVSTGAAQFRPSARFAAFIGGLTIALLAIVMRLTQVQMIDGEDFAAAARANQVELIPVAAPRGLIVDRRGTVMVRSRPSFVCALIPSEVKDIAATMRGARRHPETSRADALEPLAAPSRRQLQEL